MAIKCVKGNLYAVVGRDPKDPRRKIDALVLSKNAPSAKRKALQRFPSLKKSPTKIRVRLMERNKIICK